MKINDIHRYFIFRALIKRYVLPVLVVWMADSGLTAAQISFIISFSTFLSFIFEIPSGAFSDYFGHKKTLILSMLVQSLSMLMFLGGGFYWILAASGLYWLGNSLMSGTMQALFFERLKVLGKDKEHKKLDGQAKSISQGAGILFMATAGFAYMWHTWLPFIIGSVQFLVAAKLIADFGETHSVEVKKFDRNSLSFSQIKEFVSLFKKYSFVFSWMLAAAFFVGAAYVLHNYDQLYLHDIGVSAGIIGFVYVGKRIVGMLAPLFVYKVNKQLNDLSAIILFSFLVAIGILLTGTLKNPYLWVLALYIMMAGSVALKIVANDFVNQGIDNTIRATVLSIGASFTALIKFISISAVGALMGLFSLSTAFLFFGIFLIITLLIFIFWHIFINRLDFFEKK